MKRALLILSLALVFCGCSEKPVDALVQPGAEAHLKIGDCRCTLHVSKRDGSLIQGIRLVTRESDGTKTVIVADSGTISTASDHVSIIVFLDAGRLQSKKTQAHFSRLGPLILKR